MIVDGKSATLTFNGFVIGKVDTFDINDAVTPVEIFKSMSNSSRATPGVVNLGRITVNLYRDTTDAGQIAMQAAQAGRSIVTLNVALADTNFDLEVFIVSIPYVGSDNGTGTAPVILQVASNGI